MIDIIEELHDYGIHVQVSDPLADPQEALHEYGVTLVPGAELKPAVAVVAAVAHAAYRGFTVAELAALMGENPVLVDVKGLYRGLDLKAAGIRSWTL